MRLSSEVSTAIARFSPAAVSPGAASFAREATALAEPESSNRAKALLFAASRLAAFAESVGLELCAEVLLRDSVIERFCAIGLKGVSHATRRTVRSNLRAIARAHTCAPPPVLLGREKAKAPYTVAEIATYLALADAQPTESRRMRAIGLICLGAGAGLVGADLRGVTGRHVVARSGGLIVEVTTARRPRSVPVLSRYHNRLETVASFFAERFIVGGIELSRRNVTTPLVSSLAGGRDLCRIEVARLRATWLATAAEAIGLKAFMDAAGIYCSQRLGDLVASLPAAPEDKAVALLGGSR